MALDAPRSRVLEDALAFRHEEGFERSLGRAVRRHGGDYEDYMDLIGLVRELARTRKTGLREAARVLAAHP